MPEDIENTPPPVAVRPFDFLRRPLFVFSLLFLAWIFFGQRLVPHHQPETAPVAPAKQEIQAGIQESIKTTEKDAQIADLQRRLGDMEAKIKAMESAAATPAKSYDDSAVTAKIVALENSLDTLQKAHSEDAGNSASLMETLHKQEDDISMLKSQLADTEAEALRRLSLMAAFNTLKDAIMRGESFAEQLKRMNELAKDEASVQPLLAQLAPYAGDNAATMDTLQSQFEATIPQALTANNSSALARRLQSIIRIRKVGEQQAGNSDEAIIARAEAKLNRGDVKGSVGELAPLSPTAAAAFAAWSKKAKAFLRIRDTLDALQPAILQNKPVPTVANAIAQPAPKPPVKQ